MSNKKSHDLYNFMNQISTDMNAEYNRIQMRATEDPGTAGDQGEENWAELLRDWLPRTYEVVTKGRIISETGETSPQIDVLVLKGSYPKKLLNKKLYLAAGVAAAFECKTTLKASHISKTMENCAKIKNLYQMRTGTPYRELHTPIVYGLLAHSHAWKGEGSTPEENIKKNLIETDDLHVTHPRQLLDILCVADLGAWSSKKITFIGPHHDPDWATMAPIYGPNGSATTVYVGHTSAHEQQIEQFTPIGVLISKLSQMLAWENPSFRDLADYYRITGIAGFGKGHMRKWPSSIYSVETRTRVESGMLSNGKPWDEWSCSF
ncbi:hypothetical protein F3F96_03855 [Mariprofundus sp. NF]|uniref:DUF6602 domain-containing protein n=1 Tax=Mariprofundus sp. NF TaxID=2608716 RepID=UPI0015A09942|nr:DUF6602 domain-containing protein [Mariprofundus sp. NF]NWF38271.1 hypothetical protein [Mariprofundus sp. NF]